jgi:hypothetical protein
MALSPVRAAAVRGQMMAGYRAPLSASALSRSGDMSILVFVLLLFETNLCVLGFVSVGSVLKKKCF